MGTLIALVVAAVACAWAWQLQQVLDATVAHQATLATRTADLEALLSDTDESVAQSAAALGAQLKVVDKETRRLEQRRREMDVRMDKIEKNATGLAGDLKAVKSGVESNTSQAKALTSNVDKLTADLASLKKVAGDLERLSKTAKEVQTNLERLADNVNKANLERAALNKRVAANEEWIESINAFRRQVNANISQLESSLRALQSSGSPTIQ
ncbi:MAG: hypothetical protein EBS76_06950 [Actinobacteria bacterium]|nr:hypothetical protein [Actinomycetota bacterium]